MIVVIGGRQEGKTREAIGWVREGERTSSYPFWTRVIVTITMHEANRLRHQFELDYNQVYHLEDWNQARLGPEEVEVFVDNADLMLRQLVRNGQITHVSLTASQYMYLGRD